MNRIWGHVGSLLVAGLAVSAVVPACATNDQSIFILGALAPSTTRTNNVCTYTTDPQQPHLLQANADLGVAGSYTAVLLVGNQLIPRGDPTNNRAESNRVHINGGIVRVTESDGTLIKEFTAFSTGLANPGSNNTPDFAVIGLTLVDSDTRNTLLAQLPTRSSRKTILINVKAFGKTLGGTDLESGEFQLPMQVCNGCLVTFPPDSIDPTSTLQPNCLAKVGTGAAASTTPPPCALGQDEPVVCTSCQGAKACDPNGVPP